MQGVWADCQCSRTACLRLPLRRHFTHPLRACQGRLYSSGTRPLASNVPGECAAGVSPQPPCGKRRDEEKEANIQSSLILPLSGGK